MKYLILYIACLTLGSVGAWFVVRWGSGFGLLDRANERSSHKGVVPKGGGIGILAAFVSCAFLLRLSVTFWITSLVLSVISFFGDKIELSPKLRLIVQFICSFIFLTGLFFFNHLNFFWGLLVFPLAVFIVGTSNFYNFMDGINGIAGITGVIGFLLLATFGIITESDPKYVAVSVAISCSCLGFLPYNIPKARVFMGDVGSILLGFVFACMVVVFSQSLLDFICLSGFLFPFYADELTTMFARIKGGESLTKPHRRHLYQILANERGIDHWKISVGYGAVQLIVGTLLLSFRAKWEVVLMLLILFFSVFSIVSAFFRYAEFEKHSRLSVK